MLRKTLNYILFGFVILCMIIVGILALSNHLIGVRKEQTYAEYSNIYIESYQIINNKFIYNLGDITQKVPMKYVYYETIGTSVKVSKQYKERYTINDLIHLRKLYDIIVEVNTR